jgi:hypothetical protein
MPPVPNGFIAYIHASFMQQVYYISSESGNLTYSLAASWMMSRLVLK